MVPRTRCALTETRRFARTIALNTKTGRFFFTKRFMCFRIFEIVTRIVFRLVLIVSIGFESKPKRLERLITKILSSKKLSYNSKWHGPRVSR